MTYATPPPPPPVGVPMTPAMIIVPAWVYEECQDWLPNLGIPVAIGPAFSPELVMVICLEGPVPIQIYKDEEDGVIRCLFSQ